MMSPQPHPISKHEFPIVFFLEEDVWKKRRDIIFIVRILSLVNINFQTSPIYAPSPFPSSVNYCIQNLLFILLHLPHLSIIYATAGNIININDIFLTTCTF